MTHSQRDQGASLASTKLRKVLRYGLGAIAAFAGLAFWAIAQSSSAPSAPPTTENEAAIGTALSAPPAATIREERMIPLAAAFPQIKGLGEKRMLARLYDIPAHGLLLSPSSKGVPVITHVTLGRVSQMPATGDVVIKELNETTYDKGGEVLQWLNESDEPAQLLVVSVVPQ